MSAVVMTPCGEASLRVQSRTGNEERDWRVVHNLARSLRDARIPGLWSVIPTYDSILVDFDSARTNGETVEAFVALIEAGVDLEAPVPVGRRFVVPVVYGGEFGPDLAFVAQEQGLSEAGVIALHTGADLRLRCLGGPAASCMTDGPAFPRPVSRLPDPRLSVPANAVSVAGRQGVIGPVKAPSGWRLIGLTPIEVMSPGEDDVVAYAPGDTVRFRAIPADDWSRYAGRTMREMAL